MKEENRKRGKGNQRGYVLVSHRGQRGYRGQRGGTEGRTLIR